MKKIITTLAIFIILFTILGKDVFSADTWTFTESPIKTVHTYNTETECNIERNKFLAKPIRQDAGPCVLQKTAEIPKTTTTTNPKTTTETTQTTTTTTNSPKATTTETTQTTTTTTNSPKATTTGTAQTTTTNNPEATTTETTQTTTRETGGALNVTPQQNVVTDLNKYKLLAPFVGFTEAPEQIGDYLNKIFILAIGLCVALAVLMMIIAGVQYMGEESIFGKMNAKGQIKNALLGLLIALSAYALLNTIDPRLLGKGGASIKTINLQIDKETETIPWSEYAPTGNIKMCPSGFVDVKTFSSPAKINVCREIAPQLEALIKKADTAGIKISGYGTRSTAQQKKLRIKNGCPDDTTSSNSCKPPTARPGYSMHESGKAIDFNCNGKSMTDSGGQKSPCFMWLSKNASPLLKNLASEPWHWSTTGQ